MFREKPVSVILVTLFAVAILPSCGTSGSSPQKPTLQSIVVSPGNEQLFLGTNQQLTATGNLTDGSTQDLTQTVTWSLACGQGRMEACRALDETTILAVVTDQLQGRVHDSDKYSRIFAPLTKRNGLGNITG